MVDERAVPKLATWKYGSTAYRALLLAGLADLYMSVQLAATTYRHGNAPVSFWLYTMEVSIVIIQVGIWWIALRAGNDLIGYARVIKQGEDGRGMVGIARALLWLIAYIVLVPLTSSLAEVTQHTSYSGFLIFMHNHLPIIALGFAVMYLYKGSRRLLRLTSSPIRRRPLLHAAGLYIGVAILFAWHFYNTAPAIAAISGVRRFNLPVSVLLWSYVLPHVVAWGFGIAAVFNLWHYSTQVEGAIYRQLFSSLYKGIFLVFAGTFTAQLLIASTVTLSSFSIGAVLVYAVLVIGVIGYFLIYRGVKQLVKLEAVT